MDFTPFVRAIKNGFKKDQIKVFDSIKELESLQLAELGSNDVEGYQVFTPQFIVKQMSEAIGDDCLDFSKTILEPTSGDGAFTTYLLHARLEKALDLGDFEINALKALSTIYSIEMDKPLIEKQRNNIFTLVKQFVSNHEIEVHESFFEAVKCIITTNYLWAMFNSDHPSGGLWVEVAYKMPDAEKGKMNSLDMPVWTIGSNGMTLKYEGVDVW